MDREQAVDILLVEDTPTDAELALRALKEHNLINRVEWVQDGAAAVPVVVLTSSKEDKDMVTAYQLKVNSFVSKPVVFEEFAKTIAHLGFYWLLVNKQRNGAD